MVWMLFGGIVVAMVWGLIALIQSLDRERFEAQQLRKELDLKEKQTAVILEPREPKDAIDRLDRGTF